MKKWELRLEPGSHDSARYELLIQGEMKDMARIVKKFGAMCGRPVKVNHPEGFNLRIYLHEMTHGLVEKVSAYLQEAAPPLGTESSQPLEGRGSAGDPQQTFDNFVVGPGNRFAHAAAASVVASPGTMYNPLFIYGVPSCGKTHILNALAAALGPGPILLTTGPALGAGGRMGAIDAAKALLVDDIHLMEVTDKNKPALAKLFPSFLERGLQVIVTSLYAPRALAGLEEALKISFAKGWAVDMKQPSAAVQADLMAALAQRCGAALGMEGIQKLQESSGFNYGEFPKIVMRCKVLDETERSNGRKTSEEEIVARLMGPGERLSPGELPSEAELSAAKGFSLPHAAQALPLACFYPRGQEALMSWVLARFHGIAAKAGIRRSYREVLREAYDADEPFGVAFSIGEACRRSGAGAALVLGPGKESKLAAQAGAFSHAVEHILRSCGTATGWIPAAEIVVTRPYLAAHLDLIALHP